MFQLGIHISCFLPAVDSLWTEGFLCFPIALWEMYFDVISLVMWPNYASPTLQLYIPRSHSHGDLGNGNKEYLIIVREHQYIGKVYNAEFCPSCLLIMKLHTTVWNSENLTSYRVFDIFEHHSSATDGISITYTL